MKKLLINLSSLLTLLIIGCANYSYIEQGAWGLDQRQRHIKHSTPEIVASKMALTKKRCDSNNRRSCTTLGHIYHTGKAHYTGYSTYEVKKDYVKAKKYYTKACELSDGLGCYFLGYIYERGEGFKKDNIKALEYYTKACKECDFRCTNHPVCSNSKRLREKLNRS